MRPACIIVVTVLTITLVMMTAAVVRLENYRYANFLGDCAEFTITDTVQRIRRETCLENAETCTHWFWHVLYGLKIL